MAEAAKLTTCLALISATFGRPFVAAANETLPPPSNLKCLLEKVCVLSCKWEPPAGMYSTSDCQIKYVSQIKYGNMRNWEEKRQDPQPYRSETLKLETNNKIAFRVKAVNGSKSSDWEEIDILLSPDNPHANDITVDCIYYGKEYINCTWDPVYAKPELHYWHNGLNSTSVCMNYIYRNGIYGGCHLKAEEISGLNFEKCLCILVKEKKILIKTLDLRKIVKPSPPVITNITKDENDELYVQWNQGDKINPDCLSYRVKYKESMTNEWQIRQLRYTFQVSAQYNEICGEKTDLWSEWSKEEYFGKEDWIIYVLLIISPIILGAAAILLLVYLKRLQILILPPIPDPGKLIKDVLPERSEDLQNWIKQFKENLEEKCDVVLVEPSVLPVDGNEHKECSKENDFLSVNQEMREELLGDSCSQCEDP
ncbi:interleukin-13 receptor subunit alpha-1-like isoform X2 [Latimeria chalumnae]|uniref:interleukin-13 receptor subunit alpha-1-like isoform X2 n=1 Tax=Latimeria chalumnae TaxID=7897 RepID=UPI00313E10EB